MTIYWTDKNDLVLLQTNTKYKFLNYKRNSSTYLKIRGD